MSVIERARALAGQCECFTAVSALYTLRDVFRPEGLEEVGVVLFNIQGRLRTWENRLGPTDWRYTDHASGWSRDFSDSEMGRWVVSIQRKGVGVVQ